MEFSCIEQAYPVTELTSLSCKNALPDCRRKDSVCQAPISAPPLLCHLAVVYDAPSSPKHQSHQRDGVEAPGKRVKGATPTIESVQSSCLGRIGRAGFSPVLRLDHSSPAKPTATRMIAVTIPSREARSWSYSGLRHIRLQPQTRHGRGSRNLEGASRPEEVCL